MLLAWKGITFLSTFLAEFIHLFPPFCLSFTSISIIHSYFGFVIFPNSDPAGWIEWIMPRSLSICSHLPSPSECLASVFKVFPLFIITVVKGCVLPYPLSKKPTLVYALCECVHSISNRCVAASASVLPSFNPRPRPFRVTNSDRSVKKGIMADGLRDLLNKVRKGGEEKEGGLGDETEEGRWRKDNWIVHFWQRLKISFNCEL